MSETGEIAMRLSVALEAVNDAKVPADLRAVAFRYAIEALEGGAEVPIGRGVRRASASSAYEAPLVAAIAARLQIDVDVASSIFEQQEDQVHLIVTKARLPRGQSKAAAMRDVALLIACGRQAAGLEDYTAYALIRRECEEIGVLDSPNFAVEVGRLGMRSQGGRNSREIHASRHQLEMAAELMVRIAGGDGA